MNKEWVVDQETFDLFLSWLDPNRDEAGKKYEDVRRKLIKIFTCRGRADAEELADVTINRVVGKVQEIAGSYVGDPALYFYAVARNVHLEQFKKHAVSLPMPVMDPPDEKEQQHECLDKCMSRLTPAARQMVLQYYHEDKAMKIKLRKNLAERLGIEPNALRIRMHRIRASLQECVTGCLRESVIE